MEYSSYAKAAMAAIEEIENMTPPPRKIDLGRAKKAAGRWLKAASAWENKVRRFLAAEPSLDMKKASQLNSLLMDVERAMTDEEGLKSRPYFKHLI